jgi:IPT/TIG domain-containing protein
MKVGILLLAAATLGCSISVISVAVADPTIDFLNPAEAKINWEGTVRIHGDNFGAQPYVLFGDDSPVISGSAPTYIDVQVTKRVTGTAGDKIVKVHNTSDGTLSNEVTFSVKP